MDVGDIANDFFSQLQPFIDRSIGAVSDLRGRTQEVLKCSLFDSLHSAGTAGVLMLQIFPSSQGCNPVPNDIQFSVDSFFPADIEYYAYRSALNPEWNARFS